MKKLYTLLAIIATIATFAQAPQGFNYQATVRNSTGALIVNQNVYFKFNLMLNSASSVPVFSETHYTPTDDLGQVNIVIGQGTATVGTFTTINWGAGNYYLGIELNTGSGYIAMGTTQLLSVPYALYANSSGNAPTSIPNLAAVLAVNNGANNLKISNLADPTAAQDAATKNYVDNAASANTTLPDGTIFVGNATNQATSVALSGDVTITNTGAATIANNAVNTAKIANTTVTNAKLDKANIPLSGFGAATADVNLGTKKLTNVGDPTTAQEAATKNYVDSRIAAIQTSSQGKTSIYLTGNITNAQAVTKIAAELGPYTENIYIRNTTQLTTVDLSALVTISNIEIENNSNLTTINLTNLSTIEDGFRSYTNAALSSLSFPALLTCSRFDISNCPLTSLNFPLLNYINAFYLSNYGLNQPTLATLNFPAVQTIGGSFSLSGLTSLTTLTFPMLSNLNGNISIQPAYNTNNNITTLSFPALTSCTSFDYNTNLQIFQAAPGAIYINGNAANAAINLSSLASCNSISISFISSLNLSALSSCADIAINNSSSLTSLSFPSLTNNSNLNLNGNALTSNTVNSLLNKLLTVAPASGKNVYLDQQTPPAPPTGQGLVDKQTLIVAGNQVVTDGFLPTITTTAVTSITRTTATSGGTITNDGGGTIQGSGVVWATTTNPTIENGVLSNNATNSSFTSNLTDLNAGTTYYVRAYAFNSAGTAYGNERSFTTLPVTLPTLTTLEVTSITSTWANSGGNIINDGGGTITDRGLVWSTFANPSIAINQGSVSGGTGIGLFYRSIVNLTPGVTCYVRAYATNSAGTTYGNELSFVPQNTIPGVTIGTQVLRDTNLDVNTYRDGTPIPQVTDPTAWANLTTGAWCYYANNTAGTTYGRLYNWYAVAGIHDNDPNTPNKILAPTGWHIPSDAEWTTLTTYLGGESVAGGKMKSTGTTHWQTPNTGATNLSGFNGFPGGVRQFNGAFGYINANGYWWSSSELNSTDAWNRNLNYNSEMSFRNYVSKKEGLSVRLVRD